MTLGALAIGAIALVLGTAPAAAAHSPTPLPNRVQASAPGEAEGRITEIRVHGNHTTPDPDILAIAALTLGEPATPETLAAAEARLLASRRFTTIEIRRRYQSISDPTRILIVVLVDELPGVSPDNVIPGPLARLRRAAVWFPILSYADGYGFTYGARVSVVNTLGSRSRVSTPLTWGGERRAAVEIERAFDRGPLSVVRGSVAVHRSINPHFQVPDARREVTFDADRALASWLRVGGDARVTQIDFGGSHSRHQAAGVHLVLDTRPDPSFPRNGALARVGWEHVEFAGGGAGRWSTDLRGYVGLLRSSVLALRARTVHASAALPPAEQLLVGGIDSLRGYGAGHGAGDGIAATSAEVRVPLTSPLSVGRFGAKVFVDTAATWPAGTSLSTLHFDQGTGGGIYFGAAAFTAGLDLAWPRHGHARWHFGLGLTF